MLAVGEEKTRATLEELRKSAGIHSYDSAPNASMAVLLFSQTTVDVATTQTIDPGVTTMVESYEPPTPHLLEVVSETV